MAKTPLILGILIAIALSCYGEDRLYHSAFFRHENKVHLSQQSWVITFALDITQYRTGLDRLRNVVEDLWAQFQELDPVTVSERYLNMTATEVYRILISRQHHQFSEVWDLINDCEEQLHNLGSLYRHTSHRAKRALLPFMGDILGALFGTAKRSDLDDVRQYLTELGRSDTQIRHIIQKSLTVLNHTTLNMIENRDTINDLIDVSTDISQHLAQLEENVRGVLQSFKQFTLRYLQVQAQLDSIYRSIIDFKDKLAHLNDKISEALQGKVTPTLLG